MRNILNGWRIWENKKLISIILILVLVNNIFLVTGKADTISCNICNGGNTEYQNYRRWSSPITSYLTTTANGQLMRVQYGRYMDIGGIISYIWRFL